MNFEHFSKWCAANGYDGEKDFAASEAAYLKAHPKKAGKQKGSVILLLRAVGILDGEEAVYSGSDGLPVEMESKNSKLERQKVGGFLEHRAQAAGFEQIRIQGTPKPQWKDIDLGTDN